MNLQEHVSSSIQDVWTEWTDNHGRIPGSDQLADAAIAAFSEALLSEAAIEAAAKVAHRKFSPRPGLPDRWEEVDAVMQNAIRYDTKDILQSVLAAMGAVTED